MGELLKIVEASHEFCDELHQLKEKFMPDLRAKLSGQKLPVSESTMEAAIDDAIMRTPQMNPTPQRAAKLKSEKDLKEPRLNNTLRRPSSCDTCRVKLEHEQHPPQMHQVDEASATNRDSTKSTASVRSEDAVVAIPRLLQ
ncbi:PREDICTED: uncharacterized protein LOC108379018 [Rhagoletis zephyria]|uniref:uncharacterized protein LOC108379018 n=1 Tax=Rhagoletis zephyria TaxID=28612 RepID=UPI00081196A2|nr:PREDICTED: uncharacterized protein LOC108379018 [Rhagoletis zephyria]